MNHCFLFFCLNLSFCQGVRLFFFSFSIVIPPSLLIITHDYIHIMLPYFLFFFNFNRVHFPLQSFLFLIFFLIFVKLFLMIYFQIHSCVKARVYTLTKEIQSRIP